MGHLSILMWPFYNLQSLQYLPQKYLWTFFWKDKKKVQAGCELMTYIFVVNTIANCVSLLESNLKKKLKMILDFTV